MSDRERQAEHVRDAMPSDLRTFADAIRKEFDAKLVYLKTPTLELGKREWTEQLERQKKAQLAARLELPANSVWQVYRHAVNS